MNAFYTLHALNPHRHLLDTIGLLPGGDASRSRVVRLVFLWTETAFELRRHEEALATVGKEYGRELQKHRKALARLPEQDPARREHERELEKLERGHYDLLTWRLMVAAREVERRQTALAEVERQLERYTHGAAAD